MPHTTDDRLDSWKEIAAYLNRGVRTVRRWESEEGLPVHRHMHRRLGSIFAYKSEIDAWQNARPSRRVSPPSTDTDRGTAVSRADKSIAVLPLSNLSTDPDDAYFADGLTEEIIADLSKVRRLRVISRMSSMALKDTKKPLAMIARELGVRYVLQGSTRRAGKQLRISAQLIDAVDDQHIWAETYDGTLDDVFAIQDRLARVIVAALELRVSDDERQRLVERPIRHLQAYECYLRARYEAWRWRPDAIDRAIQLLRNGLGMVGDSARLYAALGHAYLQYREAGIDLGERPLLEAEMCAAKVATLEPQSALGPRLRGWIQYARGDIQAAVNNLKVSLGFDPNDADTLLLLCNCYLISGQVSAARPLIERLQALDPLTPVTQCLPGFADVSEGNLRPAVEPYRRMFDMDPDNPMARLFYIWILIQNGRRADAAALLDGFSPTERDSVPARTGRFLVHAREGRVQEALDAVTPEIEAIANTSDVFARFLAEGYAMAGATERAIDWLTVAVNRGYINYPFLLQHDPCLQSVRTQPRFVELMEVVRERWQSYQA